MPKASRKGSFAVGEAGAKLARAFESEAANLSKSRLGINLTQISQRTQIFFGFRFRFRYRYRFRYRFGFRFRFR